MLQNQNSRSNFYYYIIILQYPHSNQFYNSINIMFLIENNSIVTCNQLHNQIQLNPFQQNTQTHLITFFSKQQLQLLSCHHQANHFFKIVNKIVLTRSNQLLIVKFTPLQSKLHFIKSRFLRLILLKKILARNSINRNLIFFLNPLTGQHHIKSLQINYVWIQNIKFFVEQLIESSNFNIQQIFKQYKHFFIEINEGQHQNQNSQIKQIKDIEESMFQWNISFKKFLMHSPYYTWSIFSHNTKDGFFKEDCLRESKASITQFTIKLFYTSETTLKIVKIYTNSNQKIAQIHFNNSQQDNEIKSKYLTLILNQRLNLPLIKNININNEFLQTLRQKDQIKISSQGGSVSIRMHKYRIEDLQLLKYQTQLLYLMPAQEFPGLAKYYIAKNLQTQINLYRFSDLSGYLTFDKFKKANSFTMSFYTKINIFTQIILTLRYIRNSGIVYLNLIPSNIYLKKGQLTKLFDFTNSYSNKVKGAISPKMKLPYVVINTFNNTQKEEKSDMLSFGCLLYQSLFEKNMLNIKQWHVQQMNYDQFIKKIQSKLMCIESTGIHKLIIIKLLNYFCLSCYGNKLQNIPFIDWGVILIKYLQIYSQNKFMRTHSVQQTLK